MYNDKVISQLKFIEKQRIERQRVIKEFAPLNEVIVDIINVAGGQTPHFWIAGGAVLSCITNSPIKDFDIYSPDPEKLVSLLREASTRNDLDPKQYCKFELTLDVPGYVANFTDQNGRIIQIVRSIQPQNVDQLLWTFDFTVVCGAYDGIYFDADSRFFRDIARRKIVVNNLRYPLRAMERMVKYVSRGYSIETEEMLKIAKAIDGGVADWNAKDHSIPGLY
jgi:hypothetical protein